MQLRVTKAYNQVRGELAELGILADGVYLDEIELVMVPKITGLFLQAHGWVFDSGVKSWHRLLGFEGGVIYMATNKTTADLCGGYTLTDVVRHEFSHAWYWLDKDYVDGPWFKKTFGHTYSSGEGPFDPSEYVYYEEHPDEFKKAGYHNDYTTPYAMHSSYEDFAETFRFYLKNRNSLERFKGRTGVYKKLLAVKKAVEKKAESLGGTA